MSRRSLLVACISALLCPVQFSLSSSSSSSSSNRHPIKINVQSSHASSPSPSPSPAGGPTPPSYYSSSSSNSRGSWNSPPPALREPHPFVSPPFLESTSVAPVDSTLSNSAYLQYMNSQWKELDGACFQKYANTYVYTFCPFRNMTQRATLHSLHVVLGIWNTWRWADDDSLVMVYDDGTACSGGKKRSIQVHLDCPDPPSSTSSSALDSLQQYYSSLSHEGAASTSSLDSGYLDIFSSPSPSSSSSASSAPSSSSSSTTPSAPSSSLHHPWYPSIGDVIEDGACEYRVNFVLPSTLCPFLPIPSQLLSRASFRGNSVSQVTRMQQCIDALLQQTTATTIPASCEPFRNDKDL